MVSDPEGLPGCLRSKAMDIQASIEEHSIKLLILVSRKGAYWW